MSVRQLTPHQLTIVDLIDRILDKGVVITGDITISIVGVDLLSLKINLVIASLETAKRYGIKLPWEKWTQKPLKKISTKSSKRLR
jgi:gas vesicle protein GvpA/GvpJ/GvpM family